MPSTIKQTAFRLREEDLALLEALREHLGVLSWAEVVRIAIREAAKKRKIDTPPAKGWAPRPKK